MSNTSQGITNRHSVNIEYPGGSEDNVRKAIDEFVQRVGDYCRSKGVKNLKKNYFLNYMKKKDPDTNRIVPSYCGFIYFQDPKLYYVSLGLDIDGSKLVDYIPDPNYVKKSNKSCTKLSWGDMMEEEETSYIAVEKPPIVEPITYLDDEDNYRTITPRAARVSPKSIDPETDQHVLFAIVHVSISDKFLESIFRIFSSNKEFPKINSVVMNNKAQKKVYISYDYGTYDAQFALQMTRVLPVRNRNRQEFYLNFSHARSRASKNNVNDNPE